MATLCVVPAENSTVNNKEMKEVYKYSCWSPLD